MIEMFWGDLFCVHGDATHGRKKMYMWWNEEWSRVNLRERVEKSNQYIKGKQCN